MDRGLSFINIGDCNKEYYLQSTNTVEIKFVHVFLLDFI